MSGKKRIPLEMAKKLALHNLEYLINSAENLHQKYPTLGFNRRAKNLESLKKSVASSDGKSVAASEIDSVTRFGNQLTTDTEFISKVFRSTDYKSNLHQFWHMCNAIGNS